LKFEISDFRGTVKKIEGRASRLVPLARAEDVRYRMQEGRCCGEEAALAESKKLNCYICPPAAAMLST